MSEQFEELEGTEIIEIDSEALAVSTTAEIDMQIATAKRYPRSITAFKRKALEMATIDTETAGSMFYVLPRGGKRIEGPSVRLAEIVGSAWTNIRYAAKVVEVGKKFVTAEGVAFDVETNTAANIQVRRRITDKSGRRFNDDMVQVTANAACSIALRNAIFKVVPFQYVKDVFEHAKSASLGKGTFQEQRTKTLKAFEDNFKLKEADVLKVIGKKGLDDMNVDDIIALRGIYTALNEGDTTVHELLNPNEKPKSSIDEKIEAKHTETQEKVPENADSAQKTDTQNEVVDTETGEIKENEQPEVAYTETNPGTDDQISGNQAKTNPEPVENKEPETGDQTAKISMETGKQKTPEELQLSEVRKAITKLQTEYLKAGKMKDYSFVCEKYGAGQSLSKLSLAEAKELHGKLEKGLA